MYKNKLPYDICRCATELCPERETCLRWVTIEADKKIKEPCRISYSDNLCDGDFAYYIGVSEMHN